MNTATNFKNWFIQENSTKKFLTLYGLRISFTDNIEFAKAFNTEYDAVLFEDAYANEYDEYTNIVNL